MPRKKGTPAIPKPAKKRRARGTGSIMKDSRRGGYVARVPVGRLPSGKTKYVEVRDATQAGVIEKMKAVRPPDPNTITVKEWATRWLESLSVRDSTYEGYERQVERRIVPELGDVRLSALAVSRVRTALQKWASAGTATANRTLAVGATMMQAAILDELVAKNPFADCPKLKHEPKPLKPFTPDELKAVIGAWEKYTVGPLLAFVAATGARIGEAAALDVTDFDRETGRVAITKTWTVEHGSRPPKSKHSVRTISVPTAAHPAILFAIGTRTEGPLFAAATGERFTNGQTFIGLRRVVKALKLPNPLRNPHAMRHGVATMLVSRGVPIGDVAKYLGHTAAQVVRTYLHAAGTDPSGVLNAAFG